ncbi:MAG TPA: hypothetical protein VMR98_01480, partial [Candidatus Polarisedimenticolaceae bacterium]|nr:hypothetical protein [Candidatus Polarisedimenticolaceae bacterium]
SALAANETEASSYISGGQTRRYIYKGLTGQLVAADAPASHMPVSNKIFGATTVGAPAAGGVGPVFSVDLVHSVALKMTSRGAYFQRVDRPVGYARPAPAQFHPRFVVTVLIFSLCIAIILGFLLLL